MKKSKREIIEQAINLWSKAVALCKAFRANPKLRYAWEILKIIIRVIWIVLKYHRNRQ